MSRIKATPKAKSGAKPVKTAATRPAAKRVGAEGAFLAAAKASKKKFGPLFKRLAKT